MMSARMLLGLMVMFCATLCVRASVVDDAAALQELHDTFKGSSEQRIAAMRSMFDARLADAFASVRLTALSDDEVGAIFDAAALMAFYDRAPGIVDDQDRAFVELRRRGLADNEHVKSMFGTLIALRRFDEARELAAGFPAVPLESVPELRDAEGFDPARPSLLRVAEAGTPWQRENPVLSNDAQIIVVGHPLCHFSRNATLAIEADSTLADVFAVHSLWIGPADRHVYRDEYLDWRAQHPRLPILPILDVASWPMIDSSSTPRFYFLRGGVVQSEVVGWPEEGNRDAVIAGLKKIGLAD
jgi:hypothetical protein